MSLQHQDKSREHRSGKSTIEFAEIKGAGLKVSRVGLGKWGIGGWMWGGTDEENSIKTIGLRLHLVSTLSTRRRSMASAAQRRSWARPWPKDCASAPLSVGLEWHDGKITRNSSRDRIMR